MAERLRLMAFSDTHSSTRYGMAVAQQAARAEVHAVVCAGDFSTMGDGWDAGIAPLVYSGRKLLAVSGNHERPGIMERVLEAFPWVIDLEATPVELGPFTVAGFGAAAMNVGPWEPGARLRDLAEHLMGRPQGPGRLVLVTHVPPAMNHHGGETEEEVRRFVEAVEPELVIAGHVHRAEGHREAIGPTQVACVGPRGALLELAV